MNHLHRYEVLKDTPEVQIEKCQDFNCGKILKTKKGEKGRISNKEYLEEHKADFAQPFGRTAKTFRQVYGDDNEAYQK